MSEKAKESPAAKSEERREAPQISADELSVFYETHFGDAAATQFGQTFLNPAVGAQVNDDGDGYDAGRTQWEEEDDLGYYADGVKRTLTDDQIAMFRHSELQKLRRQQEKAALKKHKHHEEDSDDGQQDSEDPPLEASSLPSRFTSTKKRKKTQRPKEPKPDLRKRTWDVVEKGLDTLDYD